MNVQRYIAATVAAFVFVFAFEFLWHAVLLEGMYRETQALWRPKAEMGGMIPVAMGFQLALAAIIAYIFTRHYEGKGLAEGLRFGTYFGVLFAVGSAAWYAYLPIPVKLAGAWFVGGFLYGLGTGVVLSLVYRR